MIFTLVTVIVSLILFILSLILIPEIKIRDFKLPTYWIPPLLGSIVLLCSKYLDFSTIISLSKAGSMNTVEILVLFISMAIISLSLDSTGFFDVLAVKCVKNVKSQKRLFFIIGLLVSLLTIVTSNDIIILTITPFIIAFARKLNINPMPYLIEEFVLANSFSSFLLIGNPTNIFLTSFYDISFFEYAKVMILPSLVSGLVSFGLLFAIYNKELRKPISESNMEVKIEDKRYVIVFGIILILTTVLLSVSNFIDIPMYIISAGFAVIDLIILIAARIFAKKKYIKPVLKHMPWFLAPFVLCMSILVLSLEHQGILSNVQSYLSSHLNNNFGGGLSYSLITLLLANITNNIPASLLTSKLLPSYNVALYGSVLALNLGAFVTPVGALAGIMWKKQLNKKNVELNVGRFMIQGLFLASISLISGVFVLWLFA